MLKNYFKLAIKVLFRRKFFTFISLFGISLTLMVLMVVTAFLDNIISPNYPEINRDRSLYVSRIHLSHSGEGSESTSSASFSFLKEHVETLKTAQKVAITNIFTNANIYAGKQKLSVNLKRTNAAFWEVMEFEFLEGKAYTEKQIDDGAYVAVITDKIKREYFGDIPSVVGELLEINNEKFRVQGVVKAAPIVRIYSSADIYLPYSTAKSGLKGPDMQGMYVGILLANSPGDFSAIEAEYQGKLAQIELPDPKRFNQLDTHADTYLAGWMRTIMGSKDEVQTSFFFMIIFILMFMFMLLPAINLINVNSSRIMERASEIGVRKAFGASSSTLVYQFVIENIIITFIGGGLGVLLAWIVMALINNSGWIAHLDLTMNLNVLGIGILLCLFFGFLSGVFPALKMSKLHVVNALKANEI